MSMSTLYPHSLIGTSTAAPASSCKIRCGVSLFEVILAMAVLGCGFTAIMVALEGARGGAQKSHVLAFALSTCKSLHAQLSNDTDSFLPGKHYPINVDDTDWFWFYEDVPLDSSVLCARTITVFRKINGVPHAVCLTRTVSISLRGSNPRSPARSESSASQPYLLGVSYDSK